MENLNAENIINEIQSLIKALKDCGGWVKRGNGEGWFNHEILADALALINSQEQRIKELTEENAPKWIPIESNEKPQHLKNYFIAYVFGDSDMRFCGEAKYHAYGGNGIVDGAHFSNEGVDDMRVTHWMPIPKLP